MLYTSQSALPFEFSSLLESRMDRFTRRRAFRGFTLIEILLVLAIIAIASSVAVVSYQSLMTERRIDTSADKLLLEMDGARNKAIRTGQIQVFRFLIGKNSFTLQPWMGSMDEINTGPGSTVVSGGQVVSTEFTSGSTVATAVEGAGQKVESLDDTVVIQSVNMASDSRSMMIEQEAGVSSSVDGTWSSPILFYPDGQATTVEIIISDPKGRRRAIQLRGYTGQCSIVQISPGAPL